MPSNVYSGNMKKQEEEPIAMHPLMCIIDPRAVAHSSLLIAHIPSRLLIAFLPITYMNGSALESNNHSSINHLRPPLSDDPTRASASTALYAVSWARRTARIACIRGSCRLGDIDYFALARSDCSLFNNDRGVRATAETHFPLRLMPHNACNVEK